MLALNTDNSPATQTTAARISELTWYFQEQGLGSWEHWCPSASFLQSHLLHGHCCEFAQEPTSLRLMFHHSLQRFGGYPRCWSSHTGTLFTPHLLGMHSEAALTMGPIHIQSPSRPGHCSLSSLSIHPGSSCSLRTPGLGIRSRN